MAIYKHVSTDLKHSGWMEARVPNNRFHGGEDETKPRVCVAPTIADCLTAIPGGGMRLDELNISQRGYYLVMTINTEKLGIRDEDIMTTEVLYEQDLVRDADITNEVWITTSFQVPPEDMEVIQLSNWREDVEDVVPYHVYQLAEEKFEGDIIEAYEETFQERVPCVGVITDLSYTSNSIKNGERVSLYFDDETEKGFVLNYITNAYSGFEVIDDYLDEVVFTSNTDVTGLEDIYFYHAEIAGLFI